MKKNIATIKYDMTLTVPETDIRWIICQHCKKRVYGVMVAKDHPEYTSGTSVAKYTWKPKKK